MISVHTLQIILEHGLNLETIAYEPVLKRETAFS